MMYVQQGNVFFVPVLRERLAFAIAVQRVFRQLKVSRRDLVAVELPDPVRTRISDLLRPGSFLDVQVMMARSTANRPGTQVGSGTLEDAAGMFEVFPVTPCDAVVEAMRSAEELGCRVVGIDLDIVPEQLPQRSCSYEHEWPDDTLALEMGIAWFQERVAERLRGASTGRESQVDHAREAFMAQRLRGILARPVADRVIVVCSLERLPGVRTLLAQEEPPGQQTWHDLRGVPHAYAHRRAVPSIARIYLDDIPKVTEDYEQCRAGLGGWAFDKAGRTMEIVVGSLARLPGALSSRHEIDAFVDVCSSNTEGRGRIAPQMADIEHAVGRCFRAPGAILRHLQTELMSYDGRQVGEPPQPRRGKAIFLLRYCPPMAEVLPVRLLERTSDGDMKAWPPCKRLMNAMRRSAQLAAVSTTRSARLSRFRGSIERGIDLRRTMRASFEQPSGLYVRSPVRPQLHVESDEPVLWIFDGDAEEISASYLWIGLIGDAASQYIGADIWQGSTETVDCGHRGVQLHPLIGFVAYCDVGVTLDCVRHDVGKQWSSRLSCVQGCTPPRGGRQWWLNAAARAAAGARRHVVCVVPPGFAHLAEVEAAVHDARKKVQVVRINAFERNDVERLARMYWMPRPSNPDTVRRLDTNLREYEEAVESHYGDAITRLWQP